MSLRFFVALSLLLVPLSGCIAGVGTMSAESGLNTATKHVEDLLDTDLAPILVGVASIEPFSHYLEKDGDYEFEVNIYADPTPGDGKIPGWAYAFCVGDDIVVVFLAAGIGALADVRESDGCDEDDVQEYAIRGWEIDSDEAAGILADHDDWPEPRKDSVTMWALGQMPGDDGETFPAWFVETSNLAGDEDAFAYATVNAKTGEILALGTDYPDYGGDFIFGSTGSCTSGHAGGGSPGSSVPTVVDELRMDFELPHTGYISFAVQTSNQLGDVTVRLEGPDGDVYSDTITVEALEGDSLSKEFEDLAAGDYALYIATELTASIGYEYEYGYSTC